ncbi:MAG: hypothetical protein IPK53_11615 [bacterium]|nr:hypothetical protein [bacterium]
MKTMMILFVALFCCSAMVSAAILQVPSQYVTIIAAHAAAANGDTILVGPGTFMQRVDVSKRITLIGAGYDLTTITSYLAFATGSARSVSEGIRLQFGAHVSGVGALIGEVDSLVFRRCFFNNTATGNSNPYAFSRNVGTGGGRLFFDGCIFMTGANNNGWGSTGLHLGGENAILRNCLFADPNGTGDNSAALGGFWNSITTGNCCFLGFSEFVYPGQGGSPIIVHNSTVFDSSADAVFVWNLPPGSTLDYCASEGGVPPGATNHITIGAGVNPFVNYNRANNYQHGVSDLHPAPGSLLIDAGHPGAIDILDGTRMDIGLYGGFAHFMDGGIPNYPYVESLTIPPMIISGQDLQINAVGRIGRGY